MVRIKPPMRKKTSAHNREKELSILLKVSSSLSSTLDLADILQLAIESATDLLDLQTGAIYTIQQDELYLGATTPPVTRAFPRRAPPRPVGQSSTHKKSPFHKIPAISGRYKYLSIIRCRKDHRRGAPSYFSPLFSSSA